jgi:hypothetical protein
VRITLKPSLQNALNRKVHQFQIRRQRQSESHLRGLKHLALKAKAPFLLRGDTCSWQSGPRPLCHWWRWQSVHAQGAIAAVGITIAENPHQNVQICGDGGGGGVHGGDSPWLDCRSPTPPLGKEPGPRPPYTGTPMLKARHSDTPTGAQHSRTLFLLSLFHPN